MGQKAKSFKISHDLAEASVLRAKYMGYPSWASYVKALIRKDIGGLMCERRELQKLTLKEGDDLDFAIRLAIEAAIARLPTE